MIKIILGWLLIASPIIWVTIYGIIQVGWKQMLATWAMIAVFGCILIVGMYLAGLIKIG